MKRINHLIIATAVVGVMLVLAGRRSAATVLDLEAAQQAEASLIHQYDFEGANLTAALSDKKGTKNLTATGTLNRIPGAAYGEALNFPTGANYAQGTTFANVDWPNTATQEFLIRPTDNVTGVAISVEAGANHRYYFQQNGTSSFTWTRGDNIGKEVAGGLTSVPFVLNHWYYVVLQYEYFDAGGGDMQFRLNSWVRDLDNPSGGLVQTLNNVINTAPDGTLNNGRLGLAFQFGPNSTTWDGDLDSIGLYNTLLSTTQIQTHYEALLATPEPTAVALLGLGGFMIWRRKRVVRHRNHQTQERE